MSTQLQAEQAIFDVARKITAGDARQAYLVQVCGGDTALKARVQTLLIAYEQTNGFLESPHAGLKGPPILELPASERRGAIIGRYKLLEQIGEGGMGVVYVAEQTEPVRRRVALKIIKPGMDTRQVISRFEAERQALAMMDYANIARVLDAGTTDAGRPYFVMELVRGMPITDYCDQAQLAVRERLELFMTVCHAVQHAHQKGIIHRDLKPSNVMVTLQDGQPVVKVIDFGVAKAINQQLTERTIYTAFTEMIGTPLYMSPEQAELTGLDVDTRSDVYSLGVLLYELLTGQTPFDRDMLDNPSFDEIRRMIREDEPHRPSHRISTLAADAGTTVSQRRGIDQRQLSRMLKGELDWIVMKALEKDRNGRYESASAFAADVQRHLNNEPVEASPHSALYRCRKFARRRRAILVTVSLVVLSLLIGAGVSVWQAVEADGAWRRAENNYIAAQQAERRAVSDREASEDSLYLARARLAQRDWESGQVVRFHELLAGMSPRDGERDHRDWEWYYLSSLTQSHEVKTDKRHREVDAIAWSPDGKRLATAGEDPAIRIRCEGKPDQVVKLAPMVWHLAWSPDAKWIATSHKDGTVRVWRSSDLCEILILHTNCNRDWRNPLAWSPDSTRLATAQDHRNVVIWDAAKGQQQSVFHVFTGDVHHVACLAWSGDGKKLAMGSDDGRIRIWDPKTKGEPMVLEGQQGDVFALSWNGNNALLASAGYHGIAKVWDVQQGAEIASFTCSAAVHDVAWDPKRDVLIAAAGSRVRFWDTTTRRELPSLQGPKSSILRLAAHPDGVRIATIRASANGDVQVWNADVPLEAMPIGSGNVTSPVAWRPDGSVVACAKVGGGICAFDPKTEKRFCHWENRRRNHRRGSLRGAAVAIVLPQSKAYPLKRLRYDLEFANRRDGSSTKAFGIRCGP